VAGAGLGRTLAIDRAGQRHAGWIRVQFAPARHEVEVTLSPGLLAVTGAVLHRVRQAFDLDADPALIEPALAALPAAATPGLRLPGALDGFEVAVRAILGQQVSVAAARTLAARVVARFGTALATPFPGVDRLFPEAATLAAASPAALGRLGIVRQRVRALQGLATAVADGSLRLDRGAPLAATLRRLAEIPGVGEWTTQLVAMRALAWPDAFPASDFGVLKALGTRDVRRVRALAETWRPWRAYAVVRLWQSLENSR